jgi:MFS family permease
MPATETREPRVSSLTIVGIALASILVPLNSTMIAVALSHIAREFDIEKGHAGILVTIYLVAMLVGQPIAGRVADSVGPRRLAMVAVAGFGACSAGAVFAGTFGILVALRTTQAVFASALAPSVGAMLRVIVPERDRGRAFGVQGSVVGVGAGLGPVIGGVLVGAFGWHAIFWVNLPLVVIILVVMQTSVPPIEAPHQHTQHHERPGLRSVFNRVFSAAFFTQSFMTLAQYALLLATPIVLDARGWEPGEIGLALSALTLGLIVMSPLGGMMGDRLGRRRPVVLGLVLSMLAVGLSAVFGSDPASVVLIVSLALFGLGNGAATPGLMSAGMEAAPAGRIGVAAGLLSMSRYVGSIIGSLFVAALIADNGDGTGTVLAICFASLVAAIVVAQFLPGKRRPVEVEV